MRLLAERGLRVVALVALTGWMAIALRPREQRQVVTDAGLGDALTRWTVHGVDSAHVELDTVPDDRGLAWLAAFRGAGVGVTWRTQAIVPLGLETFASSEPAGGAVVLAAGSAGVLSDALGAIDTLESRGASGIGPHPTVVRVADVQGKVTLISATQPARAVVARSSAPKRVLVAGAAGWEAKFVIAALEEAGWQVDARLRVGPGHDVTQGPGGPLDTSRYAAVVLVDSAGAASVTGVERFARQGGGLVIAGEANRSARLASLRAWRAGRREVAPLGTVPADTLWRGLSRVPLQNVADDRAVAIETRSGNASVAARRYYAGRVVGVGYDDTWRWRMAGDANSMAAHRDWWSRLVASVAFRSSPSAGASPTGSAPWARLHATLGPATHAAGTPPRFPPGLFANLLGALAFASLLSEWLLRRARGAR